MNNTRGDETNSRRQKLICQMAALLVENNPQMPPWCTSGGITGRRKSANAALLCTNGGTTGRK
jgi:hypothetical protein